MEINGNRWKIEVFDVLFLLLVFRGPSVAGETLAPRYLGLDPAGGAGVGRRRDRPRARKGMKRHGNRRMKEEKGFKRLLKDVETSIKIHILIYNISTNICANY